MAIDGRRTSIPISDVATVLELSAPDKMRVLNAGSDNQIKPITVTVSAGRCLFLYSQRREFI